MSQQHYRLTLEEAIAHYKAGWITATALLYYYLRIRLKNGWKITLHQKEISKKLGIPKTTFYRAIEKLSKEGLINWEAPNGVVIQLVPQMELSPTNGTESFIDGTESPTNGTESFIDGTETPFKPLSSKDSGNSSYSYQIFIKSLSDKEREKFQNFCKQSMTALPVKPILEESWLNRHCEELWKIYKNSHPQETTEVFNAASQEWTIADLKRMYGAGWQEAAAHHGLDVKEEE